MLRFDIITIFPDFFREVIDCGILRRARNAGLVDVKAHDLRQWTTDKHHVVDDRPFGGGDGMILKPEPIFTGVEALTGASRKEDLPAKTRVVLLSAQGQTFSQAVGPGSLRRTQLTSCFFVDVMKESTSEWPMRW